jgi:hypothetical protein
MVRKHRVRARSLHFEPVALSAVRATAPDHAARALRATNDVPVTAPGWPPRTASHRHGVQFYESPDALCRIVGRFIGEGLRQGAAAALIVTPDHGNHIEECLRRDAIDVDRLKRAGGLVTFDARDTLDLFMANGVPNPGLFRRTVGGLLTQARPSGSQPPLRAYGEMVDLLWKDGQEAAAVHLETLWNQLARNVDFELLCGYSIGNFYKGSQFDESTPHDTHVVTADGVTAVPGLQT